MTVPIKRSCGGDRPCCRLLEVGALAPRSCTGVGKMCEGGTDGPVGMACEEAWTCARWVHGGADWPLRLVDWAHGGAGWPLRLVDWAWIGARWPRGGAVKAPLGACVAMKFSVGAKVPAVCVGDRGAWRTICAYVGGHWAIIGALVATSAMLGATWVEAEGSI